MVLNKLLASDCPASSMLLLKCVSSPFQESMARAHSGRRRVSHEAKLDHLLAGPVRRGGSKVLAPVRPWEETASEGPLGRVCIPSGVACCW